MSKTNIRSQYIKNLLADKEALSEQIKSNTKDSLRSILEDTVKDSLRNLLNEADDKDTFEVEDVEDTNTPETTPEETSEPTTPETPAEGENTDDMSAAEGAEAESGDAAEGADAMTDDAAAEGDATGDDEMWNDLEKYKGENGEYDFTGMDNDSIIKVLKVMGPEDQIRVVKNDNGTITLTDDNTEQEYVIDIEGAMNAGEGNDATAAESEANAEENQMNEEGNLGYGVRQKNDAMTTPNMNEPAPNKVNDWDEGAPKGKVRPFGNGAGDSDPFKQKVDEQNNECCATENGTKECKECKENKEKVFEIQLETEGTNEEATVEEGVAGGARVNKTNAAPYGNDNIDVREPRNHTVKNMVKESEEYNNIVRKANAILEENKELRKIAEELKKQIQEAVVVNSSLAKVINLVTENSTTRAEKVNILERFDKVTSVDEGNKLYETISTELKNTHPVNNGSNLINNQLNEAKSQPVETKLYKSDDLNETLNFWKRLEKVGK